jgi:uncharacterized integral membrane protein
MADERKPAVPPGVSPEDERSLAENVRLWGGIGALALLVLFFVQNFDKAEISFLFFSWEMPLVFALLISAAIGAAASWLFSTLRGRAARRRQDELLDAAIKGAKK